MFDYRILDNVEFFSVREIPSGRFVAKYPHMTTSLVSILLFRFQEESYESYPAAWRDA
jgi:hypothetical protein